MRRTFRRAFITLPEDDLGFQSGFIEACQKRVLMRRPSTRKKRYGRPAANPALIGAVRVPDGTVDPFRLTATNMLDAREHGAQVLTYHEVSGLLRHGDRITGVRVIDHKSRESYEIHAQIVVNAAGIWGNILPNTRISAYVCSQLKVRC